jgi:beta-glucanase (GH16 family)
VQNEVFLDPFLCPRREAAGYDLIPFIPFSVPHAYALEWEPGEIRWSVDGRQYQARGDWWSASRRRRGAARPPTPDAAADDAGRSPWPAPFDQPFHLLLNVAVGGNFPGNPDPGTAFPVEMVVDYVRVYDRSGGYGEAKPGDRGKDAR